MGKLQEYIDNYSTEIEELKKSNENAQKWYETRMSDLEQVKEHIPDWMYEYVSKGLEEDRDYSIMMNDIYITDLGVERMKVRERLASYKK